MFHYMKVAIIENRLEQKRLERKLLFKLRPHGNAVIPTELHVWLFP